MNLFHCKLTVDALMNYFVAAPDAAPLRKQYGYIYEIGDIAGTDGQTYVAPPQLKGKATRQVSMFDNE
jgi:hypothetical protein